MFISIAIVIGIVATILIVISVISRLVKLLFVGGLLALICFGFLAVKGDTNQIQSFINSTFSNQTTNHLNLLNEKLKSSAQSIQVKNNKLFFNSTGVDGEITFKEPDMIQMTVHSEINPVAANTVKKMAVTFSGDATFAERITGVLNSSSDTSVELENGSIKIEDKKLTLVLEKQIE